MSFSPWDGNEATGSMDAHAQMERYERQLTTASTTVGTNGERVHMLHTAPEFAAHVNDNYAFGHQVQWKAGGNGPTLLRRGAHVAGQDDVWFIGNIRGEKTLGETCYYTSDQVLFYDLPSAQEYQRQIDKGVPMYLRNQ